MMRIKKQTGEIKVSLHAAVLESTYDYIKQRADGADVSMGEYLDAAVSNLKKTRGE